MRLQSKYTGQELYVLLDNSMGTLFYRTYTIATEMAFELALRSETKGSNSTMSPTSGTPSGSYWEISRDGQLAGEALYLDLRRMESFYMEGQTHDFELVKAVSLCEINPLQLLALRRSSGVNFEIPEVLFDIDFPGHHCQCITSVTASITCAAGPLTVVSCMLSLLKHKYRISTEIYSYDKQKEGFFRTDRIPITSVAINKSQQKHQSHPGDERHDCGGEWAKQTTSEDANLTTLKRAVTINLKEVYSSAWSDAGATITIEHPADRLPLWARNQDIGMLKKSGDSSQLKTKGTLGGYSTYTFDPSPPLDKDWKVELKYDEVSPCECASLVIKSW
ncbi:hypothetical protein BDW59DRAFT_157158 [Aspergillus cavernicola]|uniref:Tc toxin complex TcA C-terminal TcB-binding domain-containing protein n=1 Tax=Aspergillus cavernicola TaxID=176166 RepID=A0ABR4IYZ4_9EURO